MEQLSLQLAIGFFCLMAGAWAALCLYLHATHQDRMVEKAVEAVTEAGEPMRAQAA